jgi:hypothetical protein
MLVACALALTALPSCLMPPALALDAPALVFDARRPRFRCLPPSHSNACHPRTQCLRLACISPTLALNAPCPRGSRAHFPLPLHPLPAALTLAPRCSRARYSPTTSPRTVLNGRHPHAPSPPPPCLIPAQCVLVAHRPTVPTHSSHYVHFTISSHTLSACRPHPNI